MNPWLEKADPEDVPDGARRRLLNIATQEVSLVDRAANGRRFLVVKREGAVKIFQGDAGRIYVEMRKGQPLKVTKAEAMSPEVHASLEDGLGAGMERLAALLEAVRSMPMPEGGAPGGPGPKEIYDEADAIAAWLVGLRPQSPQGKSAGRPANQEGAMNKQEHGAVAAELASIRGALAEMAKAVQGDESARARVAEVLAKLDRIIKQFGDTDNLSALGKPEVRAQQADHVEQKGMGATPPPTAGSGNQPDATARGTAAENLIGKTTASQLDASVAELMKSIRALADGQAKQGEQIAALAKAVQPLRKDAGQETVNPGSPSGWEVARVTKSFEELEAEQKVVWTDDLNRPADKLLFA